MVYDKKLKYICGFSNWERCKLPGVNLNQPLGHIKKKREIEEKRQLNFSGFEMF